MEIITKWDVYIWDFFFVKNMYNNPGIKILNIKSKSQWKSFCWPASKTKVTFSNYSNLEMKTSMRRLLIVTADRSFQPRWKGNIQSREIHFSRGVTYHKSVSANIKLSCCTRSTDQTSLQIQSGGKSTRRRGRRRKKKTMACMIETFLAAVRRSSGEQAPR